MSDRLHSHLALGHRPVSCLACNQLAADFRSLRLFRPALSAGVGR